MNRYEAFEGCSALTVVVPNNSDRVDKQIDGKQILISEANRFEDQGALLVHVKNASTCETSGWLGVETTGGARPTALRTAIGRGRDGCLRSLDGVG